MKKILMVLFMLCSFVYADKKAPKAGCILAQDGQVSVNWSDKKSKNGSFKHVRYTAIKPEGVNFKEIFVGSTIQVDTNNQPIKLTIVGMKANPRVKPAPRTGTMKINVLANGINKDISMNYTYDKNVMKAKGNLNALGLESIDFETKIKAVLCNI